MSQAGAGEGLLRSPETVCVTGAAGFIASWLVKGLLLKGYVVRGTARNPGDPKNRHLRSLEGAKERLTLHQADLLDCGSLRDAFTGCSGVFHVASPVTNNPDLVRDAVEGTRNVIRCAADVGVRRVVFTSSIGAVHMNPNRSPDAVIDESVWSDPDYCRNTKNWYCYAKMAAEIAGMEEARDRGVQLLVVVPPVTIGPMLQRTLSTSVYHLVKYLTGGKKAYPNAVQGYVDVRDVARAHILVYESPAASGRYLCLNVVMHRAQLVHMLKDMFPMYPVTTRCEDEHNPEVKPYKFSNKRLKDLGLEFTPIRQSISDTFSSLRSHGYLLDDTTVGRPIRVGYSAL